MPTQEISRNAWTDFFHAFSAAHTRWFATLEVFNTEFGAQKEARELPFYGITADLGNAHNDSISLMFGASPYQHVTHTISTPTHVRLYQTSEGANEALQIESPEGTTLVRFRSPEHPEPVPDTIVE